jgi:glycerophosphoryl diester phosphodiesterase
MHVWTVNTADELDLCWELGVEAVITDRPAVAVEHFRQRDARH